jgi:hypothetical protein
MPRLFTSVPYVVVLAGMGIAQLAWAQVWPAPAQAAAPTLPPPPGHPAWGPMYRLPPPAYYAGPAELPYDPKMPVPAGYRVVREPDYFALARGYASFGCIYSLGVAIAAGSDFANSSAYLLVPLVGPWITFGRRNHAECAEASGTDKSHCIGDRLLDVVLIIDGLAQVSTGLLVLAGHLAGRAKLVRTDLAWSAGPRRIGSGYGVGAIGSF